MTKPPDEKPPLPEDKPKRPAVKPDRAAREAAALRANLLKRKDQQRQRKDAKPKG